MSPRAALAACAVLWLAASDAPAQTIVGSKHDLSTTSGLNEPCVFCHTPHASSKDPAFTGVPLWNRTDREGHLHALPEQPAFEPVPGDAGPAIARLPLLP